MKLSTYNVLIFFFKMAKIMTENLEFTTKFNFNIVWSKEQKKDQIND
jgi:hypothetical protein